MLIASLLLSLAPCVPGAAALSDGAQAAFLPAETRFVAHFDVRALMASHLWNGFVKDNLKPGDMRELNELKTQLGLDPFVDIHSVTVFGSSPDEDSAAVMVRGTAALESALERLSEMEECTRFDVDGLGLHVFEQGSETTYIYSHPSATGAGGEHTVILSPSRTELLRSALVLRGGRNSLASAPSSHSPSGTTFGGLDLNAPAGTLLHVAFAGSIPGLDGNDPVSSILKLARGGVFSLGESRGDLLLHLGIVTESEDQALDMADGVDGLKAFANMLLRNMDDVPADVRKLLRTFRVNNEAGTVFIDFAYPLDKLFDIAEESKLGMAK